MLALMFLVAAAAASSVPLLRDNQNLVAYIKSTANMEIKFDSPSNYKQFDSYIHCARSGTRLFPRCISTRCDWAITADAVLYAEVRYPKTVCVQEKGITKAWKIVDHIERPFVLLSVSYDRTLPLNTDVRVDPYDYFGRNGPGWGTIIRSPKVLHWFIENHDKNDSKVSTLPTGFPETEEVKAAEYYKVLTDFLAANTISALKERTSKARVLSQDRVRSGVGQWKDRKISHTLCQKASYCKTPLVDVENQKNFLHELTRYQFILCTHGGGLDPSPKAWESILLGTIPIIQHGTLDDAYVQLPVVIVPSIHDFLMQPENVVQLQLDKWLLELSPYYEEGSDLRKQVLYKLTTDYWWSRVIQKYEELAPPIQEH